MLGWHGVPTGFLSALQGRAGSLFPSLFQHGKRVPAVKALIIHEQILTMVYEYPPCGAFPGLAAVEPV